MARDRAQAALLAALVLGAVMLLQGVAGQRPPPPTSLVTDEVFVVFRPGPTTAGISAQLAGRVRPLSTGGYAAILPVRSGETLAEAVKRWGASPGVAQVVPNIWVRKVGLAAADSASGGGNGGGAPSGSGFKFDWPDDTFVADSHGWALQRISAGYAWGAGMTGSTAVRICVVDTGIDYNHTEFKYKLRGSARVVDGAAFLQVNGVSVSYSGVDAAMDSDGHGTQVAALIAGLRNDVGTVGLMYSGVELLACKFMGANGYGRTSDAYLCLDWCRRRGAHISVNAWGVNMGSVILGSLDPSASAFSLIRQLLADWGRDHLFVTAAGNDRQLLDPQGLLLDPYFFLPAQLNLSNMLVVGATDEDDEPWEVTNNWGTNRGSDWVHIAAPGADLIAPKLKGPGDTNYTWVEVNGTSYAASFVAGAAGLVAGAMNDLGMDFDSLAVRDKVLAGADAVPILQAAILKDGQSYVAGGRRLNVYNALAAANPARFPRLPPELAGRRGDLPAPPSAPPSPPYPPLSMHPAPNLPAGGLRSPPPSPGPPPPPPPLPRPPPPQPKPPLPIKRSSPPPLKPRRPPPKPRPPPPKPWPPPPKPRPPPKRRPLPKGKQRPPPPRKKLPRAMYGRAALPKAACGTGYFFDGSRCRSCTVFKLNCSACSPRGCLQLSGGAAREPS